MTFAGLHPLNCLQINIYFGDSVSIPQWFYHFIGMPDHSDLPQKNPAPPQTTLMSEFSTKTYLKKKNSEECEGKNLSTLWGK